MTTRVAAVLTGLTLALAVFARHAQAEPPRSLGLEVASTCPSRAQLALELSPLLKGYALTEGAADVTASLTDLGATYRIQVGEVEREVSDPEHRCLERARVAAVFLALNLPPPRAEPQVTPPVTPPSSRPAKEPPTPNPPPPIPPAISNRRALLLRAFAQLDAAPAEPAIAGGGGAGLEGDLGHWSVSVLGALTSPTRLRASSTGNAQFELQRAPLVALLGFREQPGLFGWGAELGLAVDLITFRGLDVPHPETSFRAATGLHAGASLGLRASRHLEAELTPGITFFPRTYVVRVEPTRVLAETPAWWLGVRVGLRFKVWAD